ELAIHGATPAANVARTISAAGPVSQLSNAAASGLMAIGEAAEWIRRDGCSIAVAGGADAPIYRQLFDDFNARGWLTHGNDDPASAARPWDVQRDGFALGEGAAMVVLEDEDFATRRGARALAYVDGYGATFNRAPVAHPAANAIDAARAIQAALIEWSVTLQSEIDVIFCSASGGKLDAIEGQAIRRVWGPNTDKVSCTAIKSGIGHTLGASGALGAVVAINSLRHGLIPPTLNLREQDPDCGQLQVVTGESRRFDGNKALVNAFGVGHSASLIVSRP
ncbi:MAG TPA: beta-ketoacyl synthase N-terminal-like domain-containing protein, partial [Dehalococcoidia bacterium]